MKIMILAGGGGSRLWPLSTEILPKQFLSLFPKHSKSLLGATIERALHTVEDSAANIYISTQEKLLAQVSSDIQKQGFDDVLHHNISPEPCMRNTAPAIALTAKRIAEESNFDLDSEILVILPADHHIEDTSIFSKAIYQAEALAKQGYIVTLGIQPSKPETGYGYIEINEPITEKDWYPVQQFVEKPDLETACDYLASKRYLWNAGIFILSFKTLFDSIEQHAPELHTHLHLGFSNALTHYEDLPSISFDYAVMEHAKNIAVVPLNTGWSDVGSWDSLYDLLSNEPAYNIDLYQHQNASSQSNFYQSNRCLVASKQSRPIHLLGMEDCFVIDTEDALLIGKRGRAQDVKLIQEQHNQTATKPVNQTINAHEWGELKQIDSISEKPLNESPVYRLTLYADRSLTLSSSSPFSINVLSGSGVLRHHHQSKQISSPWSENIAEKSIQLSSGTMAFSCLIIGQLPLIEESALSNSSKIEKQSVIS